MGVVVEKVPGGFMVDGLGLKSGKCGCTSVAGCCYSWSRVKKRGDKLFAFEAKAWGPDSHDTFEWGYTVEKEGVEVSVKVQDARDKEIFSGFIPPALGEWEAKGWSVKASFGARLDGVVYRCATSKWLYKENDQAVTFDALPEDWKCPRCGSPKEGFERIG